MKLPKFDWKNVNWFGVKPSKERTLVALVLVAVLAAANYLLMPQHSPSAIAGGENVLDAAELLAPSGGTMYQAAARSSGHRPAAVRWVRYKDPMEHAFSLEVPAGWRVSGGARRFGPVDIRMSVRAVSPDGTIVLFYGDANVPPFTLPSSYLEMAGLRPGSWYQPGPGVRLLVEPYASGAAFAAGWGAQRIAQDCANVIPLAHRDRPDSSAGIDQAYASAGIERSVMAGEASFHCTLNGAPAGGYVFAATELIRMQASGMWDVNALMGAIATAPHAAEASALLAHSIKSFAIDPQWLNQQRELNRQFGQVIEQTNAAVARRIAINGRTQEEISDMIVKTGEENSNARMDAIDKYDYFGVRGRSDYRDPATGDVKYNVDNEHEHVYFNPATGQAIPSDSATPPCPQCTEMQSIDPGH